MLSPALGDRERRGRKLRRRPGMLGEFGRETRQRPQHPAHGPEIQTRIEMLNQTEHITFCRALGVPPTATVMVDNHDLALAPAILETVTRTFLDVELPYRGHTLQHDGATH